MQELYLVDVFVHIYYLTSHGSVPEFKRTGVKTTLVAFGAIRCWPFTENSDSLKI